MWGPDVAPVPGFGWEAGGCVRAVARGGAEGYSQGWCRIQHKMDRTFTPKSRSPFCRLLLTKATTSSGVRSPLCAERSSDGPEIKEGLKDSPGTGTWRGFGGRERRFLEKQLQPLRTHGLWGKTWPPALAQPPTSCLRGHFQTGRCVG